MISYSATNSNIWFDDIQLTENISDQYTVVVANDYYPYGMTIAGRTFSGDPEKDKFKYQRRRHDEAKRRQSKERDSETGYDYFEARLYDSDIGRFLQVDAYAEKYVDMSPYLGMGGNPLLYVDPTGDSLDVSNLNMSEMVTLMQELQQTTGVMLEINTDGQLVPVRDKDGNVIMLLEDEKAVGSSKGAEILLNAMADPNTSRVHSRTASNPQGSTSSPHFVSDDGRDIFMDFGAEATVQTTNGINKKTMGLGVLFIHEVQHSTAGGHHKHTAGYPPKPKMDSIVRNTNIVRAELSVSTGTNYSQRTNYVVKGNMRNSRRIASFKHGKVSDKRSF